MSRQTVSTKNVNTLINFAKSYAKTQVKREPISGIIETEPAKRSLCRDSVEIFKFKINNRDGKIFILEVKSTDFLNARQKAYEFCYKAGYCFLGRV